MELQDYREISYSTYLNVEEILVCRINSFIGVLFLLTIGKNIHNRSVSLCTVMYQCTVKMSLKLQAAPQCCRTFCLNGYCPCQSEGSLLRRYRCLLGFLHLTGGPLPPRLHPHLDGRALSHCAALHQSGRCHPGRSAY